MFVKRKITKNVTLGELIYPPGYFDGIKFEICIEGPSYPTGNCTNATYRGCQNDTSMKGESERCCQIDMREHGMGKSSRDKHYNYININALQLIPPCIPLALHLLSNSYEYTDAILWDNPEKMEPADHNWMLASF